MKFFYQSVSKIKKKNLNNKNKSNIHHKNLTIPTRVISHLSHPTVILKILKIVQKIVQNKSKMMKIQANKILISKMWIILKIKKIKLNKRSHKLINQRRVKIFF